MKPLRKIVPDKYMKEKMQDSAMAIVGTPLHMVHIFFYNYMSWRIEGWTAYFDKTTLAKKYVEMFENVETKNMVAYIDGKVYKENISKELEKRLIDTTGERIRRKTVSLKAVREENGPLYDGHYHINAYLEDTEGKRYFYDLRLDDKRKCLTPSDKFIHENKGVTATASFDCTIGTDNDGYYHTENIHIADAEENAA